ncbi:MAG: hypothetical protein ACREIC_32190 [Limisphaerales bacterium]
MDAVRAELQGQTEEVLRRRDVESETALRELEAVLRKEMQQKAEAAQSEAKQREQDLVTLLNVQGEARLMAAQAQWESEADKKARAAVEPFKAQLARAEKERDEARQSATDGARQVQQLEKKLTEASSFLSTWRNGKSFATTDR